MSDGDLPRENFPGGDVVPREGELRVTIDKKAYAEILTHAKEEPDIEICGVLLGKAKQDKHGSFLDIEHTIRGENAKGQGAQVTFTHETWNHIYKEQEKSYPKLDIVGWYHTHPGFDIFLSDMDKFIHNNFFGNPHQVAYVYDPYQGTEGFFRKAKDEIVLLDRFWHGGKPRKIVPAEQRVRAAAAVAAGVPAGGADLAASVAALSNSVKRLELELHERQSGLGNTILFGILGLAAMLVLAWQFFFARPRGQFVPYVIDSKTGVRYMVEVYPEPPAQPAPPDGKTPQPQPPEKK